MHRLIIADLSFCETEPHSTNQVQGGSVDDSISYGLIPPGEFFYFTSYDKPTGTYVTKSIHTRDGKNYASAESGYLHNGIYSTSIAQAITGL